MRDAFLVASRALIILFAFPPPTHVLNCDRATTAQQLPRPTTRAQPATTAPQARALTSLVRPATTARLARQPTMLAPPANTRPPRSQPAPTAPVDSTRTLLLSQAARPAPRYEAPLKALLFCSSVHSEFSRTKCCCWLFLLRNAGLLLPGGCHNLLRVPRWILLPRRVRGL